MTGPTPSSTTDLTVITTNRGTSFHLEDCGHLQPGTHITTTAEDAADAGYNPCQNCLPFYDHD